MRLRRVSFFSPPHLTTAPTLQAVGARNLLKSVAKQREAEQQQLQAIITEKQAQLERLRVQYQSLLAVQTQQEQFIDNFVTQK
eukprot:m.49267 g.49267  ORF g.49267 m.49267 type:complete len:83 (-) comp6467_c0_seq1:118-366(-)